MKHQKTLVNVIGLGVGIIILIQFSYIGIINLDQNINNAYCHCLDTLDERRLWKSGDEIWMSCGDFGFTIPSYYKNGSIMVCQL